MRQDRNLEALLPPARTWSPLSNGMIPVPLFQQAGQRVGAHLWAFMIWDPCSYQPLSRPDPPQCISHCYSGEPASSGPDALGSLMVTAGWGGQEPPAQTSTSEAPPPKPVTFPPASRPPAPPALSTPGLLHPRILPHWARVPPRPSPRPELLQALQRVRLARPGRSLFQNVPAPPGGVSAQSGVKITNQHHQQAARTSQQEADK